MKKQNATLDLWQGRFERAEAAYSDKFDDFDRRERLYRGEDEIKGVTRDDPDTKAPHVRNICAELIEAQVDSAIPQPKVTALREKDQPLAKIIEDMIRNELDRLPLEEINDMMSRTVPIQGGAAYLVEWDNQERTHYSVGDISLAAIHPKQLVPQDGIYSGIKDMDYIFLKMPQTKEYIRKKYGVDLDDEETETEPDVKGVDGSTAEGIVTQYIAYYRNDNGGIGKYSWVLDKELENLEDYQARRLEHCTSCGAAASVDENGNKVCPKCGGTKFDEGDEDFEEIWNPIPKYDGTEIPGAVEGMEMSGEIDAESGLPIPVAAMKPMRVPYYKPDMYPIILQKNVSLFGQFLGESDIDKVETHQNTTNRIEKVIIDKLVQGGSYMTLPNEPRIKVDTEQGKVIRIDNPADKAMIDTFDMQYDISQDMAYLGQVYEESRQAIGITDSYQGRVDNTAQSGKAKEFAAAQSAGRLESKRQMKNSAFAGLFEAIFKFRLAYTDEPIPVRTEDQDGKPIYEVFSRYDFLEQDETGEWYWNDAFLFSTDPSSSLASNREAMWQETRANFQSGSFGDPTQLQTLVLFWRMMETLHYPEAGMMRSQLERILRQQQEMQMRQQEMQMRQLQLQAKQQAYADATAERNAGRQARADTQTMQAVAEQARRDAARDAAAGISAKGGESNVSTSQQREQPLRR